MYIARKVVSQRSICGLKIRIRFFTGSGVLPDPGDPKRSFPTGEFKLFYALQMRFKLSKTSKTTFAVSTIYILKGFKRYLKGFKSYLTVRIIFPEIDV